jgi:hypothetical protein
MVRPKLDVREPASEPGGLRRVGASHAMFQHPFSISGDLAQQMTIRSLGILTVTLFAAQALYAQEKPDPPTEDYVRVHYTKY